MPAINRFLRPMMAASLCLDPFANAADWPEFRGPTGQGIAVEGEPPAEWGREKNVAWRTKIDGNGWSSPIVVGDRIYLTTAVQSLQDSSGEEGVGPDVTNNAPVGLNSTAASLSLRILAFDAATGELAWDREAFHYQAGTYQPGHAKNSFASPTPLADGERIYAHFGPLGTVAVNVSGKVLWRNETIDYDARHGGAGSPVAVGDAIVFNCDGVEDPFVVALSRKTGKELWRTSRQPMAPERFAFSTPLAIPSARTASGMQLVSPGSHMIGSYDPEDGRELWHVYFDRRWSVVSRPIYVNGIVLACNGGDSPPELLAIRPDGAGNVSGTHVVWRHDKHVPLTSSIIAADDYVFMVSDAGIATCTEIATGKLVWKKRLGGNFSASPILAGGRLYLPNDNGLCFVLAAKPRYELLAKNDLGEPILASMAVVDDALIVRTSDALYRIEESR